MTEHTDREPTKMSKAQDKPVRTTKQNKEDFERIVGQYLESNPMISTNNKVSELEIRFGTNPKISKPINKMGYDNVDSFDIKKEANLIRKRPFYRLNDCNVNLVSDLGNGSIYVRTFEKGVERETLSCGTGAVASVIAFSLYKNHSVNKVKTKGGMLKVFFKRNKLYKFIFGEK